MCGRYVRKDGKIVYSHFGIKQTSIEWKPSYNVAPTTKIPVIRRDENNHRQMVEMVWGLRPSWAGDGDKLPLLINARAETVATKPAYRSAFKSRRCIVPASGYFEWRKEADGTKQPFYFERMDGLPLAFAAIWDGETVATITTTPNAECAPVHIRMPVLLEAAEYERFLSPEPLSESEQKALLAPASDGTLALWPVTKMVGNVRNNDPHLLKPFPIDIRAEKSDLELF